MSEIYKQTFIDVDPIITDELWQKGLVHSVLRDGEQPVILIEKDLHVPSKKRLMHIGGELLRAVRAADHRKKYDRTTEHDEGRLVDTPRHMDGLGLKPFWQVHTNYGPVSAEVLFFVQSLDAATQEAFLTTMLDNPERHDSSLYQNMPEAVKIAPAVTAYRAVVKPGMSLVFKNGFEISDDGQTRELVTHKFHSVNDDGSRSDEGRAIGVSCVAELPKRRFGRRAA